MPTQQGTFDTVLAHARKQGKKSLAHNDQSSCLYRNEDGLMCFVGVLIPDDRYQETMENQTANYEGEAIHKKEVGNLLKELGYDTTFCRIKCIHHRNY